MKLTKLEESEIKRYLSYFDFTTDIENKTFLITGANGIVGTGVIKWLLLENEIHHSNVKIIGSTRNPDVRPDFIDTDDPVEYIKFGEELNLTKNKRIDYIVHAASSTDNAFHKVYPVESFRINYDCTERMIEVVKNNPDCKMIYLSSEEIYGLPPDNAPIMDETTVGAIDSLSLRSCYPLSKKASEYLCFASSVEYDLDIKIIRPTVIQGLFQKYNDPRVVNEILRCVLENQDLVLKSDGMTKKCLFYSLDAIAAIFVVLFKGKKGNAYNASNPNTFLTVKDLANHIFGKYAPNLKIVFENKESAVSAGYLPHRTIVQDITKILELGWEPKTDLDSIYKVDIERFGIK